MPEEPKTPEGAFDFRDLLGSASAGYIARPSLERMIHESAAGSSPASCVVRGEPGSGKTSVAAAMIQAGGYLHHFLRRFHTEYSLWKDPYGYMLLGYLGPCLAKQGMDDLLVLLRGEKEASELFG